MTQDPNKIVAVAAVLRPESGPYCVVRWTLGAQGSELPHLDDVFDVSLSVAGAVVAQTSVGPMGYAMLDPSRREAPDLYPKEPIPWWVAVQPTGPINPADADTEDLKGKAIGVAHILGPTATPRLRFRAARVLIAAFSAARSEEPQLRRLPDVDLVESAVQLAEILIRSRVRPRHLPQLAVREMRELHAKRGEPILLDSGRRGLAQSAHVALVLRALTVPGVVQRLEEVVEQSSSVREHIRVAGLQGGTMVDYWDDPTNSGAPHNDANRGALWPAAELVGCGCRIPLSLDQVQEWARGNDPLLVTVTHRARTSRTTNLGQLTIDWFRTEREIWLDSDRLDWGRVTSEELTPGRLRLALSSARSSHPPYPPRAARIDWGMVRVDLKPIVDSATSKVVPTQSSMSFRTGDARIEIAIERPLPPPLIQRQGADGVLAGDERTGAAYNIYGVWEGAPGFQSYFDDPATNPDLATLRPWLITRRYGFAKDLKQAFPDVGGVAHPKLQRLIDFPPWHPLLKRPDRLYSETEPDTTALPDTGGVGDAIFTFDLRTGMALPASARPPKGWEPGAPMALAWRPELDRELIMAASGRPQRYRFWVTAVDAFEQESEPLPVTTHDEDLGESPNTIFAPRRRSPLGPPPGGDALTCKFDAPNKRLLITFETPFQRQVSDQSGSASVTDRVDSTTIEGRIVLFRRLLLANTPPDLGIASLTGPPLPNLPQWRALAQDLSAQRWKPWQVEAVAGPTVGHQWIKSVDLGEDDLGWEYLAAVGVQVKSAHRAFWAKGVVAENGSGRRLTLVGQRPDGSYPLPADQPVVRISETPADSPIATAKSCMVSDPKAPWWPDITAFRVVRALPVTAPPAIRRDLILQRLLDRNFVEGGQPIGKVVWGDETLTIGQVASSVAALERTRATDPSLPPVDSDAMAAARRLLARDFRLDPGGRLRQHASIGFRGLACIEWTYTPRSVRTSATKRAEAAAFRVYVAMAPEDDGDSTNFATVIGRISRVGSSGQIFSVVITKGDVDGWTTIASRPTLVAVGPGAQVQWASVVSAVKTGSTYRVELRKDGQGNLPAGPVEARFFAAQPLEDVASGSINAISRHMFFAPISGGGPTCFAWWVTGVSAAGTESPVDLIAPMNLRRLPRTVEPPPVDGLSVRPGVRPSDALNPNQHGAWIPTTIKTTNDAAHYPRTVLTWRAPQEPLFLEIRRVEQQIARPALRGMGSDPSAWEAILTIEGLADGLAIEKVNLTSLAAWLAGLQIQAPDVESGYWRVFPPGSGLKPQGVIQLDEAELFSAQAAGADRRPAWIDYFGRNDDTVSAMDANWEFRYQLCTYVDLGVGAGAQRWLYSTPTPWSPFVIPDRPPIRVYSAGAAVRHETQDYKGSVVFLLKAVLTSRLRAEARALDDVSWEYRVIVRRQLPSAGISDNAPPWIDIGNPVRLRIDDEKKSIQHLVDDEIDRSWPGHEPKVVYRVFVQEFMETPAGERLVRAYETSEADDIQITLEAPTSAANEIQMHKSIEIS